MKNVSENFWRGKKVLVTGHTGFKGTWLCSWLLSMGAEVCGFSLDPVVFQGQEALFNQIGLEHKLKHYVGDIRDRNLVMDVIKKESPDVIFHLAAQALVLDSYSHPVETYDVNVMGTIHVLDAMRGLDKTCCGIMVTTDKCYENNEWLYGYREIDKLGGYDPYSSSKAAAEIAIQSYQRSFFSGSNSTIGVSSVRAGNVLGGGDWNSNRIIPDCIRSLLNDEPILIRNPLSRRPWQHVLEPLSGYIILAELMYGDLAAENTKSFNGAYNFGPTLESNKTVKSVVQETLKHWPGTWISSPQSPIAHEAGMLNLSYEKAFHLLGWSPRWTFEETIEHTIVFYKQANMGENPANIMERQIADFKYINTERTAYAL